MSTMPASFDVMTVSEKICALTEMGVRIFNRPSKSFEPKEAQFVRACLMDSDVSVVAAAFFQVKLSRNQPVFFSEILHHAQRSGKDVLRDMALDAIVGVSDIAPYAAVISRLAASSDRQDRCDSANALRLHFLGPVETDPTIFREAILRLLDCKDEETVVNALGAITTTDFRAFEDRVMALSQDYSCPAIATAAIRAMKRAPDLELFSASLGVALDQTAYHKIAIAAIRAMKRAPDLELSSASLGVAFGQTAYHQIAIAAIEAIHNRYCIETKVPQAFVTPVVNATDYPSEAVQVVAFSVMRAVNDKTGFEETLISYARNFTQDPRRSQKALEAMFASDNPQVFFPVLRDCVAGPEKIALAALDLLRYPKGLQVQTLLANGGQEILDIAQNHPSARVRNQVQEIALAGRLGGGNTIHLPPNVGGLHRFILSDPCRIDFYNIGLAGGASKIIGLDHNVVLDFNIPNNGPGCGPEHARQDASAALGRAFNDIAQKRPDLSIIACFASVVDGSSLGLNNGEIILVTVPKQSRGNIVTHVLQGTSPLCKVEKLSSGEGQTLTVLSVKSVSPSLCN